MTKAKIETLELKPLEKRELNVTIVGTTPLVVHKFAEKAKKEIELKQSGAQGKKKVRENRDPEAEYEACFYRLADGSYGFPVVSLKKAIVSAAHKDIGIPQTDMKKSIFIKHDGYDTVDGIDLGNPLVKIEGEPPTMRTDMVRVGLGSADIRYRPMFSNWHMRLNITFNPEITGSETILALLERAGYGIGIGEWRPAKGGEMGRFEFDRNNITCS